MKGKTRIGVIGLGGISGVHLKNIGLCGRAEIVSVCDIDPEKTKARAKESGAKGYTDFKEMFKKEKIEALCLFTPQMVREEPISICAAKHIPVFTEKPPAADMESGQRIAKLIKESRIINSVGFIFRYLKVVNRARQLLKGRPILAMQLQYLCPMMYPDSRARDFYYKKEVSGGLLIDQAIHLLDFCRFMLGEEIVEVEALGNNILQRKTKDITTEETVIMNLKSSSRSLVSYFHTWTHRGWQSRVEIFAPEARLNLDLFNKKLTGVIDGMEIGFGPEDDGYLNEIVAFFEAVSENKPKKILSTYADSLKTLALAFKINESVEREEVIRG